MTDEELVQSALSGEKAALEELVTRFQQPFYNLSVRMVWHPADAEDATQEILIRMITHLGEFRGESKFKTWAWRLAINYLINTRKRRTEQMDLSFEVFGADLDQLVPNDALVLPDQVDENLLVEEVKIGCMQGMLLCLSRDERALYVAGELFEISDQEGASIYEISPAAYRKRLGRVRESVRNFMQQKCGLANPANPCRCQRRVKTAIATGRVDPSHLLFAQKVFEPLVMQGIAEMDELDRTAALFRSHPTYQTAEPFEQNLRRWLDSGNRSFLQ